MFTVKFRAHPARLPLTRQAETRRSKRSGNSRTLPVHERQRVLGARSAMPKFLALWRITFKAIIIRKLSYLSGWRPGDGARLERKQRDVGADTSTGHGRSTHRGTEMVVRVGGPLPAGSGPG